MRTAVALLCLLALAAVPGSLLPQRGVASDPNAVPQFLVDHPRLGPWLDRAGLFEVYAAPWFAAIYLLLLVSMLGCVLPRSRRLWRNVRARPVAGPARLDRLEERRTWSLAPDRIPDARSAVTSALRTARFRVDVDGDEVRAEKGYLRELGNLGFHLSLLILLIGVGYGKLVGFEGRVVVVEGAGFTNTRSQYDEFTPATLTNLRELTPFSITLDKFDVAYAGSGPNLGQPLVFDATVSVTRGTGGAESTIVRPNEPLNVDGTKMFVTGNGYAPVITVRDAQDNVVTSGPVVFLPTDQNYASSGVIKAPDAQPEGLAFEGVFLPTAATGTAAPISAFPDLQNPQILLTVYSGDLGLARAPQSVFVIDKSNLTQLSVDGKPFQISLAPGETVDLPDGRGSLTFERVDRFVNFQVAYDPGRQIALLAAILLFVGLTASLAIPRRRWWVRMVDGHGSARIEVGGQSLTRRTLPQRDLRRLEAALAPFLDDASESNHDDRRYAHVRD